MSDCLGCSALSNPEYPRVTLSSGQEATTWCECWKLECAARHTEALRVLQIPDREARQAYIGRVRASKGDLAADRLAEEVLAEWNRRRVARQAAAEAEAAEQPEPQPAQA